MLLWNIDNNPPVTIWPSDHINSGLGEKQVAVVQNRAIWWFIITHSLTTHSCGPKMLKRMTFAIVLTEGSILPLLWPPATTPMQGGEESWAAGHSQAPGRHRSHNSSWGRVSKHGPGWRETRPCLEHYAHQPLLLLTVAVVLLLLLGVERPHAAVSRVTRHVSRVMCRHVYPSRACPHCSHLPILFLLKNKKISESESSSVHWSPPCQGGYWGQLGCSSLGCIVAIVT